MKKINFKNLPDTSTPLSAENMNLLQNNIEESTVAVGGNKPTGKEAVWFKSSRNLLIQPYTYPYEEPPIDGKIISNGLTFTINKDFTISINGTSTARTYVNLTVSEGLFATSLGSQTGPVVSNGYALNKNNLNSNIVLRWNQRNKLVYIEVEPNVTLNNELIQPMITTEELKDIPYEPYVANEEILTYNGSGYDKFADVRDTGWQDIQFKPGYSNAYDWAPCQVRRVGKMVQLRGYVKGFSTIGYTAFATLKSQFIPSDAIQFIENSLNNANEITVLNISDGGDLSFTTSNFQVNNGTALNIGTTYFVD